MHSAQLMQPSCGPWRMSMPVGQTATHWLQSMQSPTLGADFAGMDSTGKSASSATAFLMPWVRGSPRQSL
jgi:hypothetical protein